MKTILIAIAACLAFSAPALACECTYNAGGPDSTNHQSSLSSTSEGAAPSLTCND